MAASDKRGLVENVKTLRRRLSLFGRTAFGKRVPPEVVDGEMEARRAEFADMLGGVDELGAGLAEHVAVLRAYFSNSEALAEVVASYWGGGDLDRRGAWAATGLAAERRSPGLAAERRSPDLAAVEAGTRLARERWAYLNAVVRRSAAGVLVECCLDPLRTLATATKRTVTGALASYDARRADYAHFLKRGPPKDAPDALDRARADYDLARRAALDAIAAALDAYTALVSDVACCVAAVHAELVAAAAGYVGEACDALPAGAVAKARGATRDCVKVGGPAIAPEQRSAAGRALAVLTGKRELADLKREAADLEDRRRLQADQARAAILGTRIRPARGALGAPPTPPDAPNRVVVALFDCVGDDDGELSFAAGALITVVDASDDGWWTGDADGKRGVFPANYVKAAA
ncbi:hypothetical protein JL721_7651 [Aureococcus anophagefferens]|nr:hypothetical protein JL721_7651 [Aureococcus anophagefferens]